MKLGMAKETEGQRGQEVQDRQLVKEGVEFGTEKS